MGAVHRPYRPLTRSTNAVELAEQSWRMSISSCWRASATTLTAAGAPLRPPPGPRREDMKCEVEKTGPSVVVGFRTQRRASFRPVGSRIVRATSASGPCCPSRASERATGEHGFILFRGGTNAVRRARPRRSSTTVLSPGYQQVRVQLTARAGDIECDSAFR